MQPPLDMAMALLCTAKSQTADPDVYRKNLIVKHFVIRCMLPTLLED